MRKTYELNLEHKALDLKKFSFDASTSTLSAFESDLRSERFNGTYPWLAQLYNDACDIGIAIRSHVTGKICTFVQDESKGRSDDYSGGYQAWYFTATDPNCRVQNVVIFND